MARKTRRDRDQARLQATGHQDMSEIMVEITFGPIDQMAMEFPELEFNRLQPGAFEAGPGPGPQHAPGMQTRSMTAWSACHLSTPVRRRMPNTHANLVLEPPEPPAPIPLFPPEMDEHPTTQLPEAPADNTETGGACATKAGLCHHGLAEEVTPDIDVNNAFGLGEAPCTAGSSSAAWEKVLWKEQAYADNHVDHTFLEDLVVNSQLPQRQYWAMVMDAVSVSQQLSLAAAAVLAPVHLLAGTLTAMQLLIINAVLLILGYAVCALLGGHLLGGSLGRGLRQGCLLVGGVYFLSPLLKTLAATVSVDSVIALAVAALIIHLFLHDYSFVNSSTDKLSGTVALAAGALAAVLVASMMPSELHVFAQVLFALELFLLSPFVRRYVRAASPTAHATSAILLASLTAAGIATVSLGLGAAYVAVHLALTLLCPLALARITKYKAKINGPWDEAVPHIPDQLHMPDKYPPQPCERHAHAD